MLSFMASTFPDGLYFVETLSCFAVLYPVLLALYRLFLSPIAGFPGPLLPRLTFFYQFYYDWVHSGQYYMEVEKMHTKYGPIVRITPTELHIRDPLFFNQMFVSGSVRKSDAYTRFTQGTGFEDITFPIVAHNSHRAVRSRINPFFSKVSVMKLETKIVARVQKLMGRLKEFKNTRKPVNLHNAFSSLAADSISVIFHEEPTDYLADPKFNESWFDVLSMGITSIPLLAQLPWVARIIAAPLMRRILEQMTHWRIFDDKSRRQLYRSKERPSNDAKSRSNATFIDGMHDGLESIMDKNTFTRIAQLIQQGAVHNVSMSLQMTLFNVLQMDDIQEMLRQELKPYFSWEQGNVPTLPELEKLPFLSACLKEGMRLGVGSLLGIPRVFPDTDLHFKKYTIPRGTAVSMSTHWMHMDPDVFPDPEKFKPSRWLDSVNEPEKMKEMLQRYVPFGRGSRSCIGMQLAYMQLYQVMAHLFSPGSPRLLLHETDKGDVQPVRGYLFALPKVGSRGLRVVVADHEGENGDMRD